MRKVIQEMGMLSFLLQKPHKKRISGYLLSITIIVASIVVYANTLNGKFVWDDKGIIVANMSLRDVKNIPFFFTRDLWTTTGNPPGPYYRPVNNTFWTLTFQLWGANPMGYHLSNILLHGFVSFLLFKLCRKILSSEIASFFSALIFAVHPIHTENIAWISGGDYLICSVFIVLSLLSYTKYREDNRTIYLIFSVLSFTIAVFSKEYALLIPLIMLVYDVYIRRSKIEFKILLPYILVSFVYLAVRELVVTHGVESTLPLYSRMLTASAILLKYLYAFFFPFHLQILYDIQPVNTFFRAETIVSLLNLLLLALLMLYFYKKEKRAFFALLWFFIFLIPVSNIAFVLSPQMMSLRYLYIPSAGLAVLSGLYIEKLSPRLRIIPFVIILAFSVKTFVQNQYWQNDIILCEKMISDAPGSSFARNNLGVAYLDAGMPSRAISEFQRALELNPTYGFSLFNLGDTYLKLGQPDKALQYLQRAITINPSDSKAFNSLGVAHKKMGHAQEAIVNFQRSLICNPRNYEAHYNLANLLLILGDEKEAAVHYIAFIKLAPERYGEMKKDIEVMLKHKGLK